MVGGVGGLILKGPPHHPDLVRDLGFGAFTEEMALYLQAAVSTRLNIIVSGGTGSGKTTTLNALSSFIDNTERVLTIEDTAELQLQQVHVGRMESRPANVEGKGAVTQRDCLRNALRMRPDRIIVGETRGKGLVAALEIVQDKQTNSRFPAGLQAGMTCREFCFNNGLVMRAVGDTMIISPPLVITEEQVDELVKLARLSLDLTAAKLQE